MPKPKLKAPAIDVPETVAQADKLLREIGSRQRLIEGMETAMNERIAEIKDIAEAVAAKNAPEITARFDAVHAWAAANRALLTRNGQTKTVRLGAGEVRWRVTTPKVTIRFADKVIAALKRERLTRFVRVKETVDKTAILATPKAVAGVSGISISQHEEFAVFPYASRIEIAGRTKAKAKRGPKPKAEK